MTDYRGMFDREYLGAWDLQGRDVTLTITRCVAGELTGSGGKKAKKPLVYFKGKGGTETKPLALNKTNGKLIAGMYGPDTTAWVGKKITIYATTTSFGGDTVECIRVRPGIPSGKADEEVSSGAA